MLCEVNEVVLPDSDTFIFNYLLLIMYIDLTDLRSSTVVVSMGKRNRLWLLDKKATKRNQHIYDKGQSGLMRDFALMFHRSKRYICLDLERCLAGNGYQKELQRRTQKHVKKRNEF